MTGSKKALGSEVTASVLVRMTSGECALGDTTGLLPQLIVTDEGILNRELSNLFGL